VNTLTEAGLEQVPGEGVHHSHNQTTDQPRVGRYATQASGEPAWQAQSWSANRLHGPQRSEQADDQQSDQRKRVEEKGSLHIPVEQCRSHPGAPAERAVPTRKGAEWARQS
jgi:hypothetical protein